MKQQKQRVNTWREASGRLEEAIIALTLSALEVVSQSMYMSGLIKIRSRLGTQFMAFFRLIARILTFRDKKYRILAFRDKKYRILTFRDKKYRILTFRDKTESYLTVLQQNNAEAC